MKTIIISIFITILTSGLYGRENPFIPTETFLEKQKQIESELLSQATQESNITMENEEIEDENISDEIIEEEMIQEVVKEKPIYHKVLPFIKVSTLSNQLIIDIKDKYKLINQDINHKERKFVFDFRGRLNIYTKRVLLNHKDFESITVGTHKKHNFFRIVIVLKDKISSYEEDLDIDNSIIIITKLK